MAHTSTPIFTALDHAAFFAVATAVSSSQIDPDLDHI
jgi:hypothetical protein